MAQHPQLAGIRRQLDEATAHARRLADSASDRAFAQQPDAGTWSAGQCMAHLSLTTRAFLPRLDEALASAAPGGVPLSHRYRRDPLGWLVSFILEPRVRLKVKTRRAFEPPEIVDRVATIDEFAALQEALAERVDASAGRDLERLRIVSPFEARVRYNVYSGFSAILAHERRHLQQAERALARVARP